jgi:hypothetical protein
LIPRAQAGPVSEIDLAAVEAPDRETIAYPNWLGIQRSYDPSLHAEANWKRAAELLEEEHEALARVDGLAEDWESFDEIAYDEYETEGPLYGLLELRVTGLVYALNAAGCVTASSCRGHPGQGSGMAWVMFAASTERASLIASLAPVAGASIDNMEPGGIVILAPSVTEMMELARRILAAANAFDRMPPAFRG